MSLDSTDNVKMYIKKKKYDFEKRKNCLIDNYFFALIFGFN